MTFKIAVEIMFAVTVFYCILFTWTIVLLNAMLRNLINMWWRERENYVKHMTELSPEFHDEYSRIN